jgi:hypothetical protein
MKRVNPIYCLLCMCFALIFMAGCASTQNIESVLREERWNDLDAAIHDYWRFQPDPFGVNEKDMKWKFRRVADFLRQDEACKKMSESTSIDDKNACYQEAFRIWNRMPNPLPFSKSFIDDLNDRNNNLKINAFKMTRLIDLQWQQQLDREGDLKKQEKKEREWAQETDKLFADANVKARETSLFIVQSATCAICIRTVDKKNIEQAIREENKYGNKYGVVNLTKIDRYKQAIIQIDYTLADEKKEYKKVAGKLFDKARCKNVTADTCNDDLDKLQKEIAFKIVNDKISKEQDQDKKSYMIKYIENK